MNPHRIRQTLKCGFYIEKEKLFFIHMTFIGENKKELYYRLNI